MLTSAFCGCVGIQFISWGYQNVNEISHQAVPVNWVMNEHFISVLHATRACWNNSGQSISYSHRKYSTFFWQVCESCYLYQYLLLGQKKKKKKNYAELYLPLKNVVHSKACSCTSQCIISIYKITKNMC